MCLVLGPVLWKQSEIGNFTKCAHHSAMSNALRPPWMRACQASLSMRFSRQEYWSGLLSPPPVDLPDPGIKPMSPVSPALLADSLPAGPLGKPVELLGEGLLGHALARKWVRQGGAEGKTNLWGGSYSGFHHPMRSSAARKPPQIVPNGVKEAGHYNLISVVIGHRLLPERQHHLGWESSCNWDNFQSESQSI